MINTAEWQKEPATSSSQPSTLHTPRSSTGEYTTCVISAPGPSTPQCQHENNSFSSTSSLSSEQATSIDLSLSSESNDACSSNSSFSYESPSEIIPFTYKLVGDNIDKNVRPRQMRSDVQNRSLHYFHSYAVRDRVYMSQFSNDIEVRDTASINLQEVLPTCKDEEILRKNFAILVGRTLVKYIPCLAQHGNELGKHIPHEFSKEMSQKSEVVSFSTYMTVQLHVYKGSITCVENLLSVVLNL